MAARPIRKAARRLAAAAGLAALLGGPAAAEAMRVGNLGIVASRAICVETAARVLTAYIDAYGGFATSGDPEDPQAWAIYGWGLRPGSNDVVIICPTVVGQTSAFYTIHASGEAAAENADTVAEQLRQLWEGSD